MTTLDVALRLRLINELKGKGAEAARELTGIKNAAKGIEGTRGADKLKRDILQVSTASRQASRNLQDVRREASGLGSVRGPDRLKRDLLETASAARAAERALGGVRGAAGGLGRDSRGRFLPRGAAGETAEAKARAPVLLGGSAGLAARLGGGYLGYRTVSAGVRSVVEQDKAWAEVRKKVNGTPEQLEALQVELREMARKYGMSIPEAFQQAASAGAAGIDIKELPEAVRTGLMASKAWDINARDTMQTMAEMKSALGWSLQTLRDWGDKVNALADASAASERALIEAAKRSTAPGDVAGLGSDTVLGITAAQISGGMQEEVAARWLNTFSSRLAGAGAATDKQKEALRKYMGMDPQALADGMEKDARSTIVSFLQKFQGLKQQDKIAFGVKFFGQEWWDETARAAKVLPDMIRMFELLGDRSKWSGSMQGNLDIQMGTIASHWERIKAAASEVANEIDRSTGASKRFNEATDAVLAKFEESLKRRRELGETLERAEAEVQRRGEAPGAEADRLGPAVARKAIERQLGAKRRELAAAEADVARGAPRTWQGRGRPPPVMHPADVARLRMEVADMELRIRALEPRPPLDLTPPPERAPTRPELPHKPKRLPVTLPPVQPLDDIIPPGADAKARADMDKLTGAIKQGGERAVQETESIVGRIKALINSLNFTASPTISPRFVPPAGVGGGGGGGGGGGVSAPAPKPAGGPVTRSVSRGGVTIAGPLHFHGVQDVASLHRELTRLQDRDVGTSRGNALHDTWSFG